MTSRRKAQPGRPPKIKAPRETILKEAARLFAENGYENTSLQNVASAVGITKAAVYHYFATKQAMYDAIVVDMLERLDAYVNEHVDPQASPPIRLKQLLVAQADFFENNYSRFVTLLHGVAGLSRPVGSAEMTVRDRYEGFFRTLISEGVAEGAYADVDPKMTARALLSLMNWMSRWYRPDGPLRARDIAEQYFDLIWLGLKPRD